MAADTRMHCDNVPGKISKMTTFSTDEGVFIVGVAGWHELGVMCATKLFAKSRLNRSIDFKEFDPDDDCRLLILAPDGRIYQKGARFVSEVLWDFWAIGLGGQYAMAGMKMGLDPQEAVVLASELDRSTNDEVETLYR